MPTRVQTSAASIAATGAPLVLTLGAAPAPGNRLVFIVSTSGAPWAAVPDGAALDVHGDDAGRYTDVYSRPVGTGDGLSYQFTPTGATAISRGFVIELTPETGNAVVLRAAAASAATTDTTRTVDPPASAVSGSLYAIAAVGLGGTSGGADTVGAPYTTLTPPGPIESGRLHMARYSLTGTDAAPAVFSWTTARRCIAVSAVYGETAPSDPNVVLPAGATPLDAVLISQPAATAGAAPITYAITEVTSGGAVIDEHEEFYARPHGSTGREWVVPQNTAETYWRVTATSSTGKTATRTYTVAPRGGGSAGTSNLWLQTADEGIVPLTLA